LIAPHLASEFVLLGDLNWDMLNTPAVLQSKLDALQSHTNHQGTHQVQP
jgi:hypothetical protein